MPLSTDGILNDIVALSLPLAAEEGGDFAAGAGGPMPPPMPPIRPPIMVPIPGKIAVPIAALAEAPAQPPPMPAALETIFSA